MVITESLKKLDIKIEEAEVLRLLGYGKNGADALILKKIEDCILKMQEKILFKACYERFQLKQDGENLRFGTVTTNSTNLKKALKDCTEAIVFVATLGVEPDRIIQKNSMISPSDAVVAQAVGAAYIEKWCDALCEKFEKSEEKQMRFTRPRFSAGYGDFPLMAQKQIFEMLDCPRKIGVSLTESFLMVPTKSVSAIVGISPFKTNCHKNGCELCGNNDCRYRRC